MSYSKIYGHKDVYEQLRYQYNGSALSHSYIFSGKKGIGKMTFACSFAQSIFCKVEDLVTCDQCPPCRKILSNNHPDLLVIKPEGKTIKNEQMEVLQSFISIKPFESDYKIVIVDQAHTMTERAQNRILKTIEEPPGYAIFIFVTHQMERLLPTVLSRCVNLRFDDLSLMEMTEILKTLDVEDPSVMAQMMNGRIVSEFLSEDYPFYKDQIIEFSKGIANGDAEKIFAFGQFMIKHKSDAEMLFHLLIMWFRDIIIYQETKDQSLLIYKEYLQNIDSLCDKIKGKELLLCVAWFQQAQEKINSYMNYDLTIDHMVIKIDQLITSRRQV